MTPPYREREGRTNPNTRDGEPRGLGLLLLLAWWTHGHTGRAACVRHMLHACCGKERQALQYQYYSGIHQGDMAPTPKDGTKRQSLANKRSTQHTFSCFPWNTARWSFDTPPASMSCLCFVCPMIHPHQRTGPPRPERSAESARKEEGGSLARVRVYFKCVKIQYRGGGGAISKTMKLPWAGSRIPQDPACDQLLALVCIYSVQSLHRVRETH